MSFDWSPENIETLRTLWAEGKSATEISKSMGLASRSAVLGKLRRLGVYRDSLPSRPTKQRRTSPGKAAFMREARARRREAERLEQEKMREPEHAHADFVRKRLRPISKNEHAGYASKNLASRIETKLRTADDEWKFPPSAEMANAPVSKRLSLIALPPKACRYIEDKGPPWTYCAHDSLPGKSWCEAHYALCVNTVSTKEANRRAERAANWR